MNKGTYCIHCNETPCACGPIEIDGLVGVLNDAGYTTVVGAENVQRMIRVAADESTEERCSGWRVFPDGTKCDGCGDCNPND